MEAKKIEIACESCGHQVEIDFNEAQFSSQIAIINGKKKESRTFFQPCPHCGQLNTVTSENKEEWGKRKGPNVKAFMFSGFLSCFGIIALSILLAYFAFKGLGIVFDWIF
ncbi:redox protein [Lysinibacillus sp. KU-BSD001]|uniref:redox protein n=1 Tax=Lysinibacillus sp. KU-BSD001 TaxID=3141328 RepID=UPI0036E38293